MTTYCIVRGPTQTVKNLLAANPATRTQAHQWDLVLRDQKLILFAVYTESNAYKLVADLLRKYPELRISVIAADDRAEIKDLLDGLLHPTKGLLQPTKTVVAGS